MRCRKEYKAQAWCRPYKPLVGGPLDATCSLSKTHTWAYLLNACCIKQVVRILDFVARPVVVKKLCYEHAHSVHFCALIPFTTPRRFQNFCLYIYSPPARPRIWLDVSHVISFTRPSSPFKRGRPGYEATPPPNDLGKFYLEHPTSYHHKGFVKSHIVRSTGSEGVGLMYRACVPMIKW